MSVLLIFSFLFIYANKRIPLCIENFVGFLNIIFIFSFSSASKVHVHNNSEVKKKLNIPFLLIFEGEVQVIPQLLFSTSHRQAVVVVC